MLLCVYDVPLPPPLDVKRPMGSLFGMALVLAPEGDGPRLSLEWQSGTVAADEPGDAALRRLALGNPAGRALRLLEVLARGDGGVVQVALLDGGLRVSVTA